MPTYVYRCESCSDQFELVQRMVDDPIDICPSCSGKVRRVIHPVGVVFKGSGWYINDSRSKTSTASDSSTSTESSDKETKAEPVAATADKKSTDAPAAKTPATKSAAD